MKNSELFNKALLHASILCGDCENEEYTRGCAELICSIMGLHMDLAPKIQNRIYGYHNQ